MAVFPMWLIETMQVKLSWAEWRAPFCSWCQVSPCEELGLHGVSRLRDPKDMFVMTALETVTFLSCDTLSCSMG